MLSDEEYYAQLPRKIVAAGALFRDAADDILLLETSYKPDWEIPGGIVEADESPRMACRREVYEELGLLRDFPQLLCIDYRRTQSHKPDALLFVFDGGRLTDAEQTDLAVDGQEIIRWHFIPLGIAKDKILDELWHRLAASQQALAEGQMVYLES